MAKLIVLYHIMSLYIYDETGQSHHTPHVNVRLNDGRSGNISIINGDSLNGNLPSRVIRAVKDFLGENRDYVIECWNKAQEGEKFEKMEDIS